MRGKGRTDTVGYEESRITPAYAGKSLNGTLDAPCDLDHPRLCGEKDVYAFPASERLGSPPPMRGKASLFQLGEVPAGITPAYAGKSKKLNFMIVQKKDHPRLCGEKLNGTNGAECVIGSPPPMRGKVFRFLCLAVRCKDHPRLCGEKSGSV